MLHAVMQQGTHTVPMADGLGVPPREERGFYQH